MAHDSFFRNRAVAVLNLWMFGIGIVVLYAGLLARSGSVCFTGGLIVSGAVLKAWWKAEEERAGSIKRVMLQLSVADYFFLLLCSASVVFGAHWGYSEVFSFRWLGATMGATFYLYVLTFSMLP